MKPHTHLGASGILYSNVVSRVPRVLLGLRDADDEALPGMWCSPGGGVNFRETIDDAISREFMEETGLDVIVTPGFLSVQEELFRPGKHNVLIFKSVQIRYNTDPYPRPLEGFQEVRWFTWSEIFEQPLITPATKEALTEFYSQLK